MSTIDHPEQAFFEEHVALLEEKFHFRRDHQQVCRIAAARAIGRAEGRAGMGALCILASDKPEVRGQLALVENEASSFMRRDSGDGYHPMSFEERSAQEHIARAFAVNAWISDIEERGERVPKGVDAANAAPATSNEARYAAAKLVGRIEIANGADFRDLMNRAAGADLDENKRYFKPAEFGWLIGMQALGHGVSWFDDHAKCDLKIPSYEFSIGDHHIPITPTAIEEDLKQAQGAASPSGPSI